jgi:hypothetical protein
VWFGSCPTGYLDETRLIGALWIGKIVRISNCGRGISTKATSSRSSLTGTAEGNLRSFAKIWIVIFFTIGV